MDSKITFSISLWILAALPSIFLIGIFVSSLITSFSIENKLEKNNDYLNLSLSSWIEKKDTLYWLFILSMFGISSFTYQYRDNAEAVSHWGFAGTIVSIILAVVAIGFTLFQTFSHTLSSEKIANSAEDIVKATASINNSELLNASKILTETSQNMGEYNKRIESKFKELAEEISSLKQAHTESLSQLGELMFNKNEGSQSKKNGDKETEIRLTAEGFLEIEFKNLPKVPRFFVYATLKLAQYHLLDKSIQRKLIQDYALFGLHMEGEDNEEKLKIRSSAYMGSFGATRSIMVSLGVVKDFTEKDEDEQNRLLEKFNSLIDDELVDFLDEFIDDNK